MNKPEANCDFCTGDRLDGRIIYMGPAAMSLLSFPMHLEAVVHTIVVPWRHVQPDESLTQEEILGMGIEAERLKALMLHRKIGDGVLICDKLQPDTPQGDNGTVMPHRHRHVIATRKGTRLHEDGFVWRDQFVRQEPAMGYAGAIDLLKPEDRIA